MVSDPAAIDPFTLAAMSGAVSGFVGGCMNPFVSRTIGYGIRWLSDQYRGHPREAIETAQRNAVNFYGQVNICLDGLQQIEGIKEKTEQALADPDYTSLFQEAVLGASRIDSEQKHKILARLVTDRLTAGPDSLRTLAAHMACNAVLQLSPTHLRFLGLMTVIYNMSVPTYIKGSSDEETIKNGLDWLSEELSPLLPIEEMTGYDYSHLAAVSCISYGRGMHDLVSIMKWKFSTSSSARKWIEQTEIGRDLYRYWLHDLVETATLTPAGALIGMYVMDVISSDRSKWTF